MAHKIKYLKYVLLHKWNVFLQGLKLAFLIENKLLKCYFIYRLIVHDLSKFSLVEFQAYVNYFNVNPGKVKPKEIQEAFDLAWNNHQKLNRHHYQWWYLREDDNIDVKILVMDDISLLEMIADWTSFSKDFNKSYEWYKNKNIRLHEITKFKLEHFYNIVKERYGNT